MCQALQRQFFTTSSQIMRSRRPLLILAWPALLAFSGCGYVHLGRAPVVVNQPVVTDETLTKENADLRLEKKMLQQELALTRAQGDALRMAIENRAADGDTSKKLVERLNETSKELATLRASYAQLQTERNQAVASAAEATTLRNRLGATEEKLAEALRTYTDLQGEVTRLRTDVDNTRQENVALTEKVRTVTVQSEEAKAALAQLNTELLAQKDARLRAEQDAATLRTELATVAPQASALAQQRTGAAVAASSLIAEHAAETNALKEQLTTLRDTVQNLTSERTKLLEQVVAAEKAARTPSPELANVEAKLATALRETTQLREENEQLKTATTQLTTSRTELETQLAQLRAGPAGREVQSLRDQLRDAQAQALALTEENNKLKARLPGTVAGNAATPASAAQASTTSAPAPVTITSVTSPRQASGVNASLVMAVPSGGRPAIVRNDSGGTRYHVVTGGDTLAKISNQYYGTTARWGDILAANRDVLGENNNLVVGRTLRIP
jgi:chromosome segregation ATPase